MRRILVIRGETSRISRLFEVTDQTVRNALRGLVEGELTDKIRAEALRAGGLEVPKRRVRAEDPKRAVEPAKENISIQLNQRSDENLQCNKQRDGL